MFRTLKMINTLNVTYGLVFTAPPASTASRPAFRDDREPPLGWDGTPSL